MTRKRLWYSEQRTLEACVESIFKGERVVSVGCLSPGHFSPCLAPPMARATSTLRVLRLLAGLV